MIFDNLGFKEKLSKTKKSQGLSLSTVVIAALVLLVLIVLILIFSGKLGSWNKNVETCPPNSVNIDGNPNGCDGMTIPSKIINVDGETRYCCPKEDSSDSNN